MQLRSDSHRELGRRLLEEEIGGCDEQRTPSPPLTSLEIASGVRCDHLRLAVCGEQRTVACAECGARLDPFEVVWLLALKDAAVRDHDAEIARCRDRLHGLCEEERRLEQRVRRARDLAEAIERRARAGAQEALDL